MTKVLIVGSSLAAAETLAMAVATAAGCGNKSDSNNERINHNDPTPIIAFTTACQYYRNREPEQWQGKGKRRKPKHR